MASKVLEITKDKVLKASEKCPQAKEVLKELFSEAFEDEGVLTEEFKKEAREYMRSLEDLTSVNNEPFDVSLEKVRWIIANFLYSYVPGEIDNEVGQPYENLRENNILR